MPQHVFHDIRLHIVWHTKNDEPLESVARDDVSGWKQPKTARGW